MTAKITEFVMCLVVPRGATLGGNYFNNTIFGILHLSACGLYAESNTKR